MIKYFYFEDHKSGDQFITKNEKVLDEKPETTLIGRRTLFDNNIEINDWVEKGGKYFTERFNYEFLMFNRKEKLKKIIN
jgi:hypothetical protein